MTKLEFLEFFHRVKGTEADLRAEWGSYVADLRKGRAPDAMRLLVFIGSEPVAQWRALHQFMALAHDDRFVIRLTKRILKSDYDWADLLWVQRSMTRPMIVPMRDESSPDPVRYARGVLHEFASRGKPTIVEFDDFFHGIPASNPVSKTTWQDGAPLILEAMIKAATRVVVSTDYLADLYAGDAGSDVWREYARFHIGKSRGHYVTIPNAIDPELWPAHVPSVDDCVNIGWAGSSTHAEDIACCIEPLRAIMHAHPHVTFTHLGSMAGNLREDPFRDLPPERLRRVAWNSRQHTMAYDLADIDILIAPLAYNDLNRAKSKVKILEAGAMAIPIICTDIESYRGDSPAVLIPQNDPKGWYDALKLLIEDSDTRRKLGCGLATWTMVYGTIGNQLRPLSDMLLSLRKKLWKN